MLNSTMIFFGLTKMCLPHPASGLNSPTDIRLSPIELVLLFGILMPLVVLGMQINIGRRD
jgi:hypothetical protein